MVRICLNFHHKNQARYAYKKACTGSDLNLLRLFSRKRNSKICCPWKIKLKRVQHVLVSHASTMDSVPYLLRIQPLAILLTRYVQLRTKKKKGLAAVHKRVRSRRGGECLVRTRGFFRCRHQNFLVQKHRIFRNLWCVRTMRGWANADIFWIRGLIFRDFVRTSPYPVYFRKISMHQQYIWWFLIRLGCRDI